MSLALKSTIPLPKSKPGEQTSIVKALKKGMAIPETSVIFLFSAAAALGWGQDKRVGMRCGGGSLDGEIVGDVFTVKVECLDIALWKIAGVARTNCFIFNACLGLNVFCGPRIIFLVCLEY